ncbi:MAG: type II toxin-antitoxin system VapC family toxin [Rubrobacteraceae bacterium]
MVKRYLKETGTPWIRTLADPSSGNTIAVAEITLVEVAAALAARHRVEDITIGERDEALALFLNHYVNEYEITTTERPILDRAVNLTQNHRLRGYDAVQLATSLAASDLPDLAFIAADEDLVSAARTGGLQTNNPNLHQ